MVITLDAITEQRIQEQLDRGAFSGPAEMLTYALDLIESQAPYEDWLLRNKDAIQADLEESFAQAARGETFSAEQSRADLLRHRASRVAQAA